MMPENEITFTKMIDVDYDDMLKLHKIIEKELFASTMEKIDYTLDNIFKKRK